MSTSIRHILTIAGKTAKKIETSCEELLARRNPHDPKGYGSEDWSVQEHRNIASLCESLIASAYELPVVYYSQWLDGWKVADSVFWLLDWPDDRRRQVCGSDFGLAFYPSRICDDLLSQIQWMRRRKFYRTQAEDRWYLDHLKEAIEAAKWLETQFLVVSISRCLGPTRLDEEIRTAIDKTTG